MRPIYALFGVILYVRILFENAETVTRELSRTVVVCMSKKRENKGKEALLEKKMCSRDGRRKKGIYI